MATFFGTDIGTVLTWSLCGLLIETFGWSAAFYGPAVLTALFVGLCYFLIFNSPAQHPRIQPIERKYIEQSINGLNTDQAVSQSNLGIRNINLKIVKKY